jgi:prevent-host-death family protein
MTIAETSVPLSIARNHLSALARRVRHQHERIALTRNGEAEALIISVDDLDGLDRTLEILSDSDGVSRITESLAALGRGEEGVDPDVMHSEALSASGVWVAERLGGDRGPWRGGRRPGRHALRGPKRLRRMGRGAAGR